MSNINFDNPFLLLIIIPLLAIVTISFIIAIKKDNVNFHNVTSLIIHIVISFFITLALAKTTYELVITETTVYVLADCSYSTNNNLDLIDEYIDELYDNVPKNSKIGVVTFGNDYELLYKPGEKAKSVKESSVDQSATNIEPALRYTSTLFSDNVIKRIVIISDGKESIKSDIVSLVEQLELDDFYIDAIYIDSNPKEEFPEVQIDDVVFTSSTYLDREEIATVSIRSTIETDAILTISREIVDGDSIEEEPIQTYTHLTPGINIATIYLDTSVEGIFDYNITVETEDDTSEYNNNYYFTQEVVGAVKVLFISENKADKLAASDLYPNAEITIPELNQVPYTVEALCEYDEIVLSNVDIRNIRNYNSFIVALDTVVSEFGKSLFTSGNLYIQNNEDNEALSALNAMLPLNYGNDDDEDKLVCLIIDISRSMETLDRMSMAKIAAKSILDLLDDTDKVMVIGFAGDSMVYQQPTDASNREEIKKMIDGLETSQGTYMGVSLLQAYQFMYPLSYDRKQIYLISDGKPYGTESEHALDIAYTLGNLNIQISTINTSCDDGAGLMQNVAKASGGSYFYAEDEEDMENVIINEVANEVTDVLYEGDFEVFIERTRDDLVSGIYSIPNVNGFFYSDPKNSAKNVLTTKFSSVSGKEFEAPIYYYWEYGNGKVSTLTTDICGDWVKNWTSGTTGHEFLERIVDVNTPDERISSPFTLDYEISNGHVDIIVSAPTASINTIITLTITKPNNDTEDIVLAFDSENYVANFELDQTGKYLLHLKCQLSETNIQEADYTFYISYSDEYDSFTLFESSSLYTMITDSGKVSEDGVFELVNDDSYLTMYEYDFTIVLMVISIILFIVDIVIRKLKWDDIRALFGKRKK